MSTTRRFFPFITLIGLFIIAGFLANTFVDENQIPLFLVIFLVGLLFWIYAMGGGWRAADKDTVIIVEDFTRTARAYEHGSYLYIPILNAIEAKMPNYPIVHEFPVDAIDTKTPKIAQIKQITVQVSYRITDFMVCFHKSTDIKQMIKDLEQSEKLQTDNPTLWIKALNKLIEGLITETIRTTVWEWAAAVASNEKLKLEIPFTRASTLEHDPYALSLNRDKLSGKVLDEVRMRAQRWGLVVKGLAFEKIEIDPKAIDGATRDKDREIVEARHLARKEAVAIEERGLVEAKVRADTIAKIIEVLVTQQQISVTDQMLYNIVRAAMYSDGQMIWNATMEKPPTGNGPVKTA